MVSIKKEKPSNGPAKTKVIRTPGSTTERIAQACDRCRLKKTRCDGKRPQCSQCAAVGFECKVSDKLSRRAFPRGYTETLEERVRELEAENKRLLALLDLRDEQMELYAKSSNIKPLSSTNLSLLNKQKLDGSGGPPSIVSNNTASGPPSLLLTEYIDHDPKHVHSGPGCCANYPHSVNERPVSIAGSVDLNLDGDITDDDLLSLGNADEYIYGGNGRDSHYNNISFEQHQAPGLTAALAISKMKNNVDDKKTQLATLVSMSVPRSTEETLFIPSLLSKIGEVHGFNSKAALSTATTLASVKEFPKSSNPQEITTINFTSLNFKNISQPESNLFFNNLKLPSKIQLDQLITLYFQEWGAFIPIIDKNDFSKQYLEFSKSLELKFLDNTMVHKEKFGALLIIITQLGLLSFKSNQKQLPAELNQLLQYYDHLIHELITSSIASTCCIQSLQILSLSLFYCLNIGDVITAYVLRGRAITMAQQLRLHRCPSAVLGSNGSTVSKHQQAERRILFWCIYSLDTFASLQLGVPRLLKDYEIECALPFGNDDEDDDNDINFVVVNDSKISLVGKVSNLSLAIMRYSKVLGNILDTIFKRHSIKDADLQIEGLYELSIIHENLLDSWRRDLPLNIKFEMDVNGLSKQNSDPKKSVLIMLYYSAKILIHLPVIASEVNSSTRGSSSFIAIQQCSLALLNNLSDFYTKKSYYLPIPINIIRFKIRLGLLSAKGALEYTRGGALFQESKNLLSQVINELKQENSNQSFTPGNISQRCLKLTEAAIESILSPKSEHPIIKKPSNNVTDKKRSSPTSVIRSRGYSVSAPSPLSGVTVKQQPHQGDDELSHMLSQLDAIPPILPTTQISLNNQRVPSASSKVQRQRSLSIQKSSPPNNTSPPNLINNPNIFNFNGQNYPPHPSSTSSTDTNLDDFTFNDFDIDLLNHSSGFDNVELEFGADGTIGLAPWLGDSNGSGGAGGNSNANGNGNSNGNGIGGFGQIHQSYVDGGALGSNGSILGMNNDHYGNSNSVTVKMEERTGGAAMSLFDWQNSH